MNPDEEKTYRLGVRITLDEILVQAKTTNGRLRWVEKMVWGATGFCACVTILLVPVFLALIQAGKL